MDPYTVIEHPLSTEKSIRLMESENKLVFAINKKATKTDVKKAIEEIYKVKVVDVKTMVTSQGQKRAYVRFSKETPAVDIATQLGLI